MKYVDFKNRLSEQWKYDKYVAYSDTKTVPLVVNGKRYSIPIVDGEVAAAGYTSNKNPVVIMNPKTSKDIYHDMTMGHELQHVRQMLSGKTKGMPSGIFGNIKYKLDHKGDHELDADKGIIPYLIEKGYSKQEIAKGVKDFVKLRRNESKAHKSLLKELDMFLKTSDKDFMTKKERLLNELDTAPDGEIGDAYLDNLAKLEAKGAGTDAGTAVGGAAGLLTFLVGAIKTYKSKNKTYEQYKKDMIAQNKPYVSKNKYTLFNKEMLRSLGAGIGVGVGTGVLANAIAKRNTYNRLRNFSHEKDSLTAGAAGVGHYAITAVPNAALGALGGLGTGEVLYRLKKHQLKNKKLNSDNLKHSKYLSTGAKIGAALGLSKSVVDGIRVSRGAKEDLSKMDGDGNLTADEMARLMLKNRPPSILQKMREDKVFRNITG